MVEKVESIVWVKIPEVILRESDGYWNTFCVVTGGEVILDGTPITFPVGWETDITSTPPWARGFLSQLGPHSPAALIHDRLLDLGHKREVARYYMSEQLRLLEKVSKVRRFLMVAGVWLNDQRLKFV